MTSAQRTHLIAMVVVVSLTIGGLIFMTSQIAGSAKTGANGDGADTTQIEQPKDTFMSNCQAGTLGAVDCGCLNTRLESAGYTTDDQWRSLITAVGNAAASPQTVAPPVDYSQALTACRI